MAKIFLKVFDVQILTEIVPLNDINCIFQFYLLFVCNKSVENKRKYLKISQNIYILVFSSHDIFFKYSGMQELFITNY